tara:strand:+ start:709 stop:1254 length:546 start_codon:yes stop_codon:yes gene_type:complete
MIGAVEILNNFGNLVPSLYTLTRAIFGVVGFITAYQGLKALVSKESQSRPGTNSKAGGVTLIVIGAFMFTSGSLVEAGNYQISQTYADYSTLNSFTESSDDTTDTIANVLVYYLRYYSYVLSFFILYNWKEGVTYNEKGWAGKCFFMFFLSVAFLGIAAYSNAIGELFGYSSIGTDYFTID